MRIRATRQHIADLALFLKLLSVRLLTLFLYMLLVSL